MKHCANPKCPGLIKFKAVSEFEDVAKECSDCGGLLIDGEAPLLEEAPGHVDPNPDLELVNVFTTRDESTLVIAESLLAGAEIPYLTSGEGIQDLFGMGRLVAVNPITGPVDIYIGEDNVETARELLAELQV